MSIPRMELLSPAGSKEALIAAVQNGADAVYLGAQILNARASAANFDREGLKWAVEYCHERNVAVHVTVNTMVKESEQALLEDVASQLSYAGADAAIVQDFGAAKALKVMLPSLKIHASTQMAIHNPQGVRFAREQGFDRVVLAREMSFEEIRSCAGEGVELETFVHGALCVSCSGQCLFSSLVGGRSGNRGQCAQPCRLPYRLEGAVKASGYLLSPKDLMALDELDALRNAGVVSLKIEGRLKRPEYVAVVTGIYRRALDGIRDRNTKEALMQIFNRGGFTRGYGPGLNDRELMSPEKPNHAGVPVGIVTGKAGIRADRDLLPGDHIALRDRNGEEYPVKSAAVRAGETLRAPLPKGVVPGDRLWRLVSEAQMRSADESFHGEKQKIPLKAFLTAVIGKPAAFTVSDGIIERSVSGAAVEMSKSRPFDEARVRAQLVKTGDTPYAVDSLDIAADPQAFLAVSALNELRRQALAALAEARIQARRGADERALPIPASGDPDAAPPKGTILRVQASDPDMLQLALKNGADEVIFLPEDLSEEGLNNIRFPFSFVLAVPDTLRGEALSRLNQWAWMNKPSACLLSNAAHLAMDWPGDRQLDAGLNLASKRALAACGEKGFTLYTPSVELNAGEIREIGEGGKRELIVCGRLRLMTLRHCPIRAVTGGAHDACRRCDAVPDSEKMNAHALIDRVDARFPLRRQKGEAGCMVKVMNSVPLFLLRRINQLPPAATWRIILTDETKEEAANLIRLHRMALDGKDFRADPAWEAVAGKATTTGHDFRGAH